jgi:glycosyl-4,4'-diaponeurosporenoate acyltransferase
MAYVLRLIALNAGAWLVIHLGAAWAGTRLPVRLFRPSAPCFRIRPWERRGRVYDRVLRVKAWKDRLPDGASWFSGGFPKRRLLSRDPQYLRRFLQETCRGEAVHWAVLALFPLFFLWNPWWAGLINLAYALLANLPCIVTQRYNRARMDFVSSEASSVGPSPATLPREGKM